MKELRSLPLVALLVLSHAGLAQQRSVLFIGNSYTQVNDLPNLFRQVSLSLGDTVQVAASDPGGYTFLQHSTYAPTLGLIHSQPWEYVVLQEQSQIPSFSPEQVADECYPYATALCDTIRANNACSQPVFYMTWGRQNGDADNCPVWPPVCTYDGMQQRLRESYLEMAFTNSALAAPAGAAWKQVRDTHPTINLYNADGSHPSVEGSYLVACVMYSTMFRQSTEGAPFISSLQADTAAVLQHIASAIVLDSLTTWNIGVNDADASFTYTDVGGGGIHFTHGGSGTHTWNFGNGNISTEASPTEVFSANGQYTVTHTFTNECGSSTTSSTLITVVLQSVAEQGSTPVRVGAGGEGECRIIDAPLGSSYLIVDALGRTEVSGTIPSNRYTVRLSLGFHVWRIQSRTGPGVTGSVVIH